MYIYIYIYIHIYTYIYIYIYIYIFCQTPAMFGSRSMHVVALALSCWKRKKQQVAHELLTTQGTLPCQADWSPRG